MSKSKLPAAAGALLLLLSAGCQKDATTPTTESSTSGLVPASTALTCDPGNGDITLPPGFCAVVVADTVGIPRHLAVAPNGDLYVALNPDPDSLDPGGVLAVRDTDGDGRADLMSRFGTAGGSGIALKEGLLWLGRNDRIERYQLAAGELVPPAAPVEVVTGLPYVGDHPAKTVVLYQGRLIVNIASASNSCQEENRVTFSPGIRPCPELPVRAGVWDFDPHAAGQTQATGQRFATGIRNTTALAVEPATRRLIGVMNGRDELHEDWPTFFSAQDDLVLPGEELLDVRRGHNYGWPYCFYDGIKNLKVLAPEYGGDGDIVGRCADADQPLASYPAHWAPLSIMFYTGTMFPAKYRNGAFIAFHGSHENPLAAPFGPGYNVAFVPFQNGSPSGPYEIFADGFIGRDNSNLPTTAAHRPIGLAQGPDGSLYITDDQGGRIWRVIYTGQ